MSDHDLFKESNEPVKEEPNTGLQTSEPKAPAEQPSQYEQMLSMIVNAEGKPKYTSIEDALKGAAHAQAHIANLERDMAELRANGENTKKIEDVIASIKAGEENQPIQPNPDEGNKSFTESDIQELVRNAVTDITTKSVQENNIKEVTGKFRELYGEKASETLYSKADDLGMSKEDINSLIAKNPKAAFRILGIGDNKSSGMSFNSNVNTEGFQGKPPAQVKSSMGYISEKDLTSNWLSVKERTKEKLG